MSKIVGRGDHMSVDGTSPDRDVLTPGAGPMWRGRESAGHLLVFDGAAVGLRIAHPALCRRPR